MNHSVGHCGDCGVCILEMDHHCVFFDACIGKANMCLFGTVICGFFALLVFVIILAAFANGVSKLEPIADDN